jgi:hypothetical protein
MILIATSERFAFGRHDGDSPSPATASITCLRPLRSPAASNPEGMNALEGRFADRVRAALWRAGRVECEGFCGSQWFLRDPQGRPKFIASRI